MAFIQDDKVVLSIKEIEILMYIEDSISDTIYRWIRTLNRMFVEVKTCDVGSVESNYYITKAMILSDCIADITNGDINIKNVTRKCIDEELIKKITM